MYKLAFLATLGFAASAQFLSNTRDLQGYNGTVTTATLFSAACTTTATTDSCPQNFCCASLRRSTAAAPATFTTVSGTFCAPVEFNATAFNVSGAINTWTCSNAVNANSFRNVTASRKACGNDTECEIGSCCATFTDFFAVSATASGSVANRRFCLDGTKDGVQLWANYTSAAATAVGTGSYVQISQGSCTNNVPPASFGAYIKASLMMVAAVLSVALF
jgi:hypothetical protein